MEVGNGTLGLGGCWTGCGWGAVGLGGFGCVRELRRVRWVEVGAVGVCGGCGEWEPRHKACIAGGTFPRWGQRSSHHVGE